MYKFPFQEETLMELITLSNSNAHLMWLLFNYLTKVNLILNFDKSNNFLAEKKSMAVVAVFFKIGIRVSKLGGRYGNSKIIGTLLSVELPDLIHLLGVFKIEQSKHLVLHILFL